MDVRDVGLGFRPVGGNGNPSYCFFPPSRRICIWIRSICKFAALMSDEVHSSYSGWNRARSCIRTAAPPIQSLKWTSSIPASRTATWRAITAGPCSWIQLAKTLPSRRSTLGALRPVTCGTRDSFSSQIRETWGFRKHFFTFTCLSMPFSLPSVLILVI